MSDLIPEFFEQHVMAAPFQLNELVRKTGVQYKQKGREITFTASEDATGLAKELHNKVLEFGTWKVLREVAEQDVAEVVEIVSPELPPTPPLGAMPPGPPKE
jgi:hypothetical protein